MKGINTFTLKLIGLITMVVDHVGAILFPEIILLRIIGRISFPIFAYTLTEGFCHTRDIRKYILRVGILAVLSEIPFNLAFYGNVLYLGRQNVLFTFCLGLVMLYLFLMAQNNLTKVLVVVGMFLLSEALFVDYSSMGLAMILAFYCLRDKKWQKLTVVAAINVFLMGYLQVYALVALLPIALHNREQGPRGKWFFAIFYPAHLLTLYLIALIW